DREDAVGAGLQVGAGPRQAFVDPAGLGALGGTGQTGVQEDVDAGVDHESVAALRGGPAHPRQPLRLVIDVAQAAGGVIAVFEVATGGAELVQSLHQGLGLQVVAALGVDGDRHVHAGGDPGGGGQHLVGRRAV